MKAQITHSTETEPHRRLELRCFRASYKAVTIRRVVSRKSTGTVLGLNTVQTPSHQWYVGLALREEIKALSVVSSHQG